VNKQTTRETGKGNNQKVVPRAWEELPRGGNFYSILINNFYLVDIFLYFTCVSSKNVINTISLEYN